MRWLAASARALIVLLLASVLVFGSARAANTVVTAIVCAPSTGSVITLYQPLSDSTVNKPDVVVAGKVTQAMLVDISVDGIHQKTVNFSALNQEFSVMVTLIEGTHEIKLTSPDICKAKDGFASTIITYNPGATPSQGALVPTSTTGGMFTGDSVVNETSDVAPLQTLGLDTPEPANELLNGVIDNAQPVKPINATPAIVSIPFVVGAGAFGWIHLRHWRH